MVYDGGVKVGWGEIGGLPGLTEGATTVGANMEWVQKGVVEGGEETRRRSRRGCRVLRLREQHDGS